MSCPQNPQLRSSRLVLDRVIKIGKPPLMHVTRVIASRFCVMCTSVSRKRIEDTEWLDRQRLQQNDIVLRL